MDVGRGGAEGDLGPLYFKIYISYEFFSKTGRFLSFEKIKQNFTTFWTPPLEISLTTPEKIDCRLPLRRKTPSDAHARNTVPVLAGKKSLQLFGRVDSRVRWNVPPKILFWCQSAPNNNKVLENFSHTAETRAIVARTDQTKAGRERPGASRDVKVLRTLAARTGNTAQRGADGLGDREPGVGQVITHSQASHSKKREILVFSPGVLLETASYCLCTD